MSQPPTEHKSDAKSARGSSEMQLWPVQGLQPPSCEFAPAPRRPQSDRGTGLQLGNGSLGMRRSTTASSPGTPRKSAPNKTTAGGISPVGTLNLCRRPENTKPLEELRRKRQLRLRQRPRCNRRARTHRATRSNGRPSGRVRKSSPSSRRRSQAAEAASS